jgi:hypothetical protein
MSTYNSADTAKKNNEEDEMKKKPTETPDQKEEAVNIPAQGSSSPMGGENNLTGNSADRQGDTSNSSGGSYRKSNKEI